MGKLVLEQQQKLEEIVSVKNTPLPMTSRNVSTDDITALASTPSMGDMPTSELNLGNPGMLLAGIKHRV